MGKKIETIKKDRKLSEDCEKTIRKLEKEIRKLKSENKTLENALIKTEEHIFAISQNKTIDEVFKEVKENANLKTDESCPNCGSHDMRKINLSFVKIIACKCGYRNRVNEEGSGESEKT